MAKPTKILQLLQLLSHRSVVTMETIKKVCGIPRRTAFRYINTLSDADVPVYFDRERGGYCLSRSSSFRLEEFSRQELVVLSASLELIKGHVNEQYQQVLDTVLAKIVVRQAEALEEIIAALETNGRAQTAVPDYSSQLSLVIAQFAAMSNLPASITVSTGPTVRQRHDLDRCRLQFRQQWQLAQNENDDSEIYEIDQVAYVSLDK